MKAGATSDPMFSVLLVLGSMTSLTVGGSLAKSLFPALGPIGTTVLRLGIASIILLIFRRPWRVSLNREQWTNTCLYGAVLGLMNMFFYLAIARLPIALAIGIEFLGPLALALGLSRNARDLVWVFLALMGIVLILPRAEPMASDSLGIVFALLAAAFWAAYIVMGRRVGRSVPTANVTAYGTAIGALLISPLGGLDAFQLVHVPHLIPVAIGVGLLSSAIPYTLEILALKNLDSKTFGILLSLEPAVGAVAAFLLLGERLTTWQVAAIACVMTASVGSTLASRRARKAPLAAEVVAS